MIRTITIFVAAMALSVDAFAFGKVEKTESHNQQPLTPIMDVAFYSQNLQAGSFQPSIDQPSLTTQASAEKQSKLIIEFYVYILIIMIYSLYWLRVS
ncbi:MAG: hypothetical protein ACXWTP_13520 [Methylosarcina sp.]|jgi:hypothetical protein